MTNPLAAVASSRSGRMIAACCMHGVASKSSDFRKRRGYLAADGLGKVGRAKRGLCWRQYRSLINGALAPQFAMHVVDRPDDLQDSQRVPGSSPGAPTNEIKDLRRYFPF